MGDVLAQLELNDTFFFHFGLFFCLFWVLSRTFFSPFQKLLEQREQRTLKDRESAQSLLEQAKARLDEYHQRLASARQGAQARFDAIFGEGKKEESEIFSQARADAKKITQEALSSGGTLKEQLFKDLDRDVSGMAEKVVEKLLA